MTEKLLFFGGIVIMVVAFLLASKSKDLNLYDVTAGTMLTEAETKARVAPHRFIVVGEQHGTRKHHQVQLQVIKILHNANIPIAIGMEMFRRDSQEALNQWVDGNIEERKFEIVFLDNWGYSWPAYRPILLYARENRIPVVGLNVPRGITSQVVREGFKSLTQQQRGMLPSITCDVSPAYREYIKDAYGAHAHEGMDFIKFCEAQLVWDTAMAVHALDYAEKHPNRRMVILCGSGHARKPGIPAQIRKRSSLSYAVILPEAAEINAETVTAADADYLETGL